MRGRFLSFQRGLARRGTSALVPSRPKLRLRGPPPSRDAGWFSRQNQVVNDNQAAARRSRRRHFSPEKGLASRRGSVLFADILNLDLNYGKNKAEPHVTAKT